MNAFLIIVVYAGDIAKQETRILKFLLIQIIIFSMYILRVFQIEHTTKDVSSYLHCLFNITFHLRNYSYMNVLDQRTSPWRSIWISIGMQFIVGIQTSIYYMSMWPYLSLVGKIAEVIFFSK